MVGETFGVLKVLCESENSNKQHKRFDAICEKCGSQIELDGGNIRRHAKTKAKGCSMCYHPSTTHGTSNHKCYKTWEGMIARCYNKKHVAYNNYGGRGIDVIGQWRVSPVSFIKWLLQNGWKKGLEVDRKDNDRGYSPENCRIVTPMINKNNTRRSRTFLVYGEKLTIAEASRKFNLKYTTIRERLNSGSCGKHAVRRVSFG